MAIQDRDLGQGGQGPAEQAPNTDDGLYPTDEGDLGQGKGGDTEPLPGSSDPLIPGAEPDPQNPDWERNDRLDDPDLPVEPVPIDEDEELTPGGER